MELSSLERLQSSTVYMDRSSIHKLIVLPTCLSAPKAMPLSTYLNHLSDNNTLRRFVLATHHVIAPFVDLMLLLRPLLDWSTRDGLTSPLQLPANVEVFLQETLNISTQECRSIWSCFREDVWQRELSTADEHSLRMRHASKILSFGLGRQIGASRVMIY